MEPVLEYFEATYGSECISFGEFRSELLSILGWNSYQLDQLLKGVERPSSQLIHVDTFIQWLFGNGPPPRKRIAVYGGAFDPITNGHLQMAAQIVQSGSADEVLVVPSGPRPDKPKLKTPAIDRYCMCQIAVNQSFTHSFPVKVSDIECTLEEAHATYDLLCALRDRHTDADFSFVIGSDWLQEGSNMAEWDSKNWDWKPGDPEDRKKIVTGHKMLSEFDFLVVKRPGYEVSTTPEDPTGLKQFGPRLSWLKMPEGVKFVEGNLSSTEIRKRATHEAQIQDAVTVKSFVHIEGLVPRAVLAYMLRESLYMSPGAATKEEDRVAVYGGAFDPITSSHLTCAAEIIHSGCADSVLIVPCGPRPDKPNLKTSPLDRYCMCKIAVNFTFSAEFPVKTSMIECFSQEAFATYDLLCSLRKKYPTRRFSFIIGSDWLQPGSNMAEWTSKNWDWKPGDPEDQREIVTGAKMLEEFDFLVIKRPGYDVPPTPGDPTGLKRFGPRLSWLRMPEGMTFIEGSLSSTEVRNRSRLKGEFGMDGMTAPGVIGYINRQGLYR